MNRPVATAAHTFEQYVKIKGKWHVREPYVPPLVHAPERTATRLEISLDEKDRVVSLLDGQRYVLPLPARGMVKSLLSAGASVQPRAPFECVVTYARGYAIGDDGEMQRKIIWAKNTPNEDDQRTRYQVGLEEPHAVDSVLVRGVWRVQDRLVRVLGAYWTAGRTDHVLQWERKGGFTTMTATELKELLKQLDEGKRS